MEDIKIREIKSGVLDQCPECGGKKFLEISMTMSDEKDGRRKHKAGLKCWDCGVIFYSK